MNVSAVGFLFQDNLKSRIPYKGKNYTCVIHKIMQNGDYSKSVISSPIRQINTKEIVSADNAKSDILASLLAIDDKNKTSKFKGATIKDGVKETEIHSMFSDKLFAVRNRDENGKNHFSIKGRAKTKALLSKNLNLTV